MRVGKLIASCVALLGLALLGPDVRSAEEKDAYTVTIKMCEGK